VLQVEEAKAESAMHSFDLDIVGLRRRSQGAWAASRFCGHLIAGSRTATSPTTCSDARVADPIYLDFDNERVDFLAYSKYRGHSREACQKLRLRLAMTISTRESGVFDFLDNVLDRSSGTSTPGLQLRIQYLVLTPAVRSCSLGRCPSFTDAPPCRTAQCCLTNRNTWL